MKRNDLIDSLKIVSPGLSNKDLIPIFSCFCFDGTTVTAYDDIVAVQAPCDFDIAGGIRGALLLGWLNACTAKEIEAANAGENEVEIKGGRSKITVPVLPRKDFIFAFPDLDGSFAIDMKEGADDFIDNVGKSLVSMGTDPATPTRVGITFAFEKAAYFAYTARTTSITSVTADVKLPKGAAGTNVIFPPRFCELLCAFAGRRGLEKLIVHEDWVEAQFAGDVRLWSATIKGADPEQFESVIEQASKAGVYDRMVSVPKGFKRAIDRALVVLNLAKERDAILKIDDGKMRLQVNSSRVGNLDDSFKIESHPEANVAFYAEDIKNALMDADAFCVIEGMCVALSGPGCLHLISVASNAE